MKFMVWKHFKSPAGEKIKTTVSKGKVMVIYVWDIQKIIPGDFTPHGVMMSIVAYQVSLQCTKEVIFTQGVLQLNHEVRLTPLPASNTPPPQRQYILQTDKTPQGLAISI